MQCKGPKKTPAMFSIIAVLATHFLFVQRWVACDQLRCSGKSIHVTHFVKRHKEIFSTWNCSLIPWSLMRSDESTAISLLPFIIHVPWLNLGLIHTYTVFPSFIHSKKSHPHKHWSLTNLYLNENAKTHSCAVKPTGGNIFLTLKPCWPVKQRRRRCLPIRSLKKSYYRQATWLQWHIDCSVAHSDISVP